LQVIEQFRLVALMAAVVPVIDLSRGGALNVQIVRSRRDR
jgi:hypothetical protein